MAETVRRSSATGSPLIATCRSRSGAKSIKIRLFVSLPSDQFDVDRHRDRQHRRQTALTNCRNEWLT